jgi:hypothetical protein
VTEESIRALFSAYGIVLDTSIKKSYVDEVNLLTFLYRTAHGFPY